MSDHIDRMTGGVLWGAAARLGQLGSSLIIQGLLGRLLAPALFGELAMGLVVIGFAALLVDPGFGSLVVRRRISEPEPLGTILVLAAASGLTVCLLVVLGAPFFSELAGDPNGTRNLRWMALGLAPVALSSTCMGVILSRGAFGTVARIDVATGLLPGLVAVAVAWASHGIEALLVQAVVTPWLRFALLSHAARPHRFAFSIRAARRTIADVAYPSAFSLVNYWSRSGDNFLVGRAHGPTALGFYSQAYKLFQLPIQFIGASSESSILVTLSDPARSPDERREVHYGTLRTIGILAASAAALVGFGANSLVPLLWGPGWEPTIPIIQLLAPLVAVQPIISTSGAVFLAMNRTRLLFLVGSANTALMVASFVIGLPWGPEGVAFAYSIVYLTLVAPVTLACVHATLGGSARVAFVSAFRLPVLVALVQLIVGALLWRAALLGPLLPLPRLLVVAGVVASNTILVLAVAGRDDLRRLAGRLSPRRLSTRTAPTPTSGGRP